MIDILLALQINNWNQKRINKQKEEVLLVGLKSDLQDNIYQLEKYHGINDKKIHVLQKIASSTYDTMTNSMSNIYELYNTRMQHAPPVRNNILQEMLSTGSIALLQNVKLKEEILNYYTFVEDRSLALGILFGEWPSIISQRNQSMRILIPKKSLKSLRSEDRLLLIQRLKDDIELLRPHINAEMQYAIKYKGTTKNLIDRANELLQLLNEELEKP